MNVELTLYPQNLIDIHVKKYTEKYEKETNEGRKDDEGETGIVRIHLNSNHMP